MPRGRNLRIRVLAAAHSLVAGLIITIFCFSDSAMGQQDSPSISFLPPATYDSGCLSNAVAIGDFDGDGRMDVVVANWYQNCTGASGPGAVSVLRGKGDGTFSPPTQYFSGGIGAFSVAIGDVNGDGKPDLVVANRCPNDSSCSAPLGQIGVLLGNGDGTFQPAISYYSGGGLPNQVVIADVNGDGHPDLVVDNLCQAGCRTGSVGILLGVGDGTFRAAIAFDTVDFNTSLAVGDLNGDDRLDVAVISGMDPGLVSVFLGNADGTFDLQFSYTLAGFNPASIAIGDLNADRHPDLVVASSCLSLEGPCDYGRLDVLLGNGDGTFPSSLTYSSGASYALGVDIADINGDNKPDLVVTNDSLNGNFRSPGELTVLLGNGDGTFEETVRFLSGGATPQVVVAADVNSDAKPDLVVANFCPEFDACDGRSAGTIGVLLNNNGSPQYATTTSVNSNSNPSLFGVPVTFTSAVKSASGSPSGSVKFYSENAALGSAALVNGSASLSISDLPEGTHYVNAIYEGSAQFNFSASTWLQQIVKHAIVSTSTALASSRDPSVYGQPVTFTAAVTSSGGIPPDGEKVTFFKGEHVLGTAVLVRGIASVTTSSLGARIHSISASYLGDASFAPSTSPVLRQFVYTTNQVTTTTTIASSLNPATYGQTVTLTSTVSTSGASIPTGYVKFISGTSGIGTAALSNGVATLTRPLLNASIYPVVAVYLGDMNNGASESITLTEVITRASTTAELVSTPNSSVLAQPVTFTATITSPTVIPTGPVTFMAGKQMLGTAQLHDNKAQVTTSTLPVGSIKVTATYYGNSNVAKSSASITQTVQQ